MKDELLQALCVTKGQIELVEKCVVPRELKSASSVVNYKTIKTPLKHTNNCLPSFQD
jgi:hypothetical protein